MAVPTIELLNWATISGSNATFGFPRRPQAGDVLLCIHSADNGSTSQMGIFGGWQTIHTASGFVDAWAGTKVYRRIATGSEPSTYTISQAPGADGVAVILAIRNASATGIVVRSDGAEQTTDTITCPGATPPSAGCLDLRWAAGTMFLPGGFLFFDEPPGFDPVIQDQSGAFAGAALAKRTRLSSAPVPSATWDVFPFVDVWQGLTILIPPGTAGGEPPAPPVFPVGTLGRGAGLWRYAAHDLLTGAYIDDIYPEQVSMDRRIGEPGAFSASIPVPNAAEGHKLRAIFSPDPSVLTTGPGRIVVHVWRGDHLWDIYWIIGARYSQSAWSRPTIEVRGSTLDAYMHYVPIRSDMVLSGDQVTIARTLITSMQSQAHANIGLDLQTGTSGVSTELEIRGLDRRTYGDVLRELAQASNGFEWMIDPVISDGAIVRRWVWGYPTLGSDTVHLVQQGRYGGDVVEWSIDIDPLRGVTYLDVRGGTPKIEDAGEETPPRMSSIVTATAHLAAGWPRIDRTIDHPGQSLRTTTLNAYANYWMRRLAGAVWVRSVSIALAADSTLTPSSLGDQVRHIMVNELYPLVNGRASYDESARLIGLGVTPNGRGNGKDVAELIFEQVDDD